ncbi:VWA domain-containing protein [Elizabethkingia meningoseptica]|uniref:vWA domain-containing protein n=1 Tax=Elizabethkingia meningoseptica TaxID=238 RepID=UPI0023AEF133|nr:VWA domain-containing protein [Elizabethkingia meningoseptica]MDE5438673.1 VWA domain-containing protein [Elizabethkingia meningoseptica]MDE5507808.1 VWA domain-containing protein [Elizabethkingia meningoseptica]MDE5516347.1 VWA domain-containing protein [Elizabethkingia meningoseptica]MDE5530657.1 VWA domain-containing protein [Elizabethkingia meningoseptica]MDE5534214.1 VWA domain-containing protein [Elizabethkingia meningoseptica]
MSDLFAPLGLNFEFESPWLLLLFVAFIPLLIKDFIKKKNEGIKVPTTQGMSHTSGINFLLFLLKTTKYIILSAIILALARPRTFTVSEDQNEGKGIDIMLSVDVSFSMLSKDLEPDRLRALSKIAQKFVNDRPVDRIGLVAYAGDGFLKVPLTTDHEAVKQEIANLNPNELSPGTAIGEGLAVAVNHLKDSKAKSKIIILMTDGVQTIKNSLEPAVAAELAANNHIKVYTIGIGTNGYALTPTGIDPFFGDLIYTEQKVEIDELALQNIATVTGGKYFRATSNESLQQIYDEINQLEKSDIKISKMYDYKEYFRYFLWIALAFLVLDALLRWVKYKILT